MMVGLENLGNTCYMNAVLQVFLNAQPVIRKIRNHECDNAAHNSKGENVNCENSLFYSSSIMVGTQMQCVVCSLQQLDKQLHSATVATSPSQIYCLLDSKLKLAFKFIFMCITT